MFLNVYYFVIYIIISLNFSIFFVREYNDRKIFLEGRVLKIFSAVFIFYLIMVFQSRGIGEWFQHVFWFLMLQFAFIFLFLKSKAVFREFILNKNVGILNIFSSIIVEVTIFFAGFE